MCENLKRAERTRKAKASGLSLHVSDLDMDRRAIELGL